LKPANIMIRRDGTVQVLDFGLTKIAAQSDADVLATHTVLSVAGSIMGTPAYMSSEQVGGEEADYRADIFAFGVHAL
jgi:serine/threonine protein kinase